MAQKLLNPFKPTAGAEPPVLVGRDKVLEDFSDGILEGVGSPGRLIRITGPRGSGKTVLLTELGDIACENGWEVVDETARKGFCARIAEAVDDTSAFSKLDVDINFGPVALRKIGDEGGKSDRLRSALTARVETLSRQRRGLLITIDEAQDADPEEMRELAAVVQHLIRERLNIALAFAGLTTGVLDLVNGDALTFLRRALPEELASIPIEQVSFALRQSIEKSGLSIEDGALQNAAEKTVGYAYLIQLIGYHVWKAGKAHASESVTIDENDAKSGIQAALSQFHEAVHESALSGLPLRAMEYLLAMTEDDGVSATADIARRLGVEATSLTSYRRLLIQRQIIEPTARGFVIFSIPYTREYLLEKRSSLLARYGL